MIELDHNDKIKAIQNNNRKILFEDSSNLGNFVKNKDIPLFMQNKNQSKDSGKN